MVGCSGGETLDDAYGRSPEIQSSPQCSRASVIEAATSSCSCGVTAQGVIDMIKEGSGLLIYAPDPNFLRSSLYVRDVA